MPTAIDQLLAEHRIIEKVLRALSGICDRLERGEAIDPNVFEQVLDFLTTFTDHRHHQKEEKFLFPALGMHGLPRDRGPIGIMLQEHCSGRALITHMKRAANGYRDKESRAGDQFVESAREYVALIREHIQKEDNVLFKVAQTLLDAQSMEALLEDFDRADAELGADRARYELEAEEMERAWA